MNSAKAGDVFAVCRRPLRNLQPLRQIPPESPAQWPLQRLSLFRRNKLHQLSERCRRAIESQLSLRRLQHVVKRFLALFRARSASRTRSAGFQSPCRRRQHARASNVIVRLGNQSQIGQHILHQRMIQDRKLRDHKRNFPPRQVLPPGDRDARAAGTAPQNLSSAAPPHECVAVRSRPTALRLVASPTRRCEFFRLPAYSAKGFSSESPRSPCSAQSLAWPRAKYSASSGNSPSAPRETRVESSPSFQPANRSRNKLEAAERSSAKAVNRLIVIAHRHNILASAKPAVPAAAVARCWYPEIHPPECSGICFAAMSRSASIALQQLYRPGDQRAERGPLLLPQQLFAGPVSPRDFLLQRHRFLSFRKRIFVQRIPLCFQAFESSVANSLIILAGNQFILTPRKKLHKIIQKLPRIGQPPVFFQAAAASNSAAAESNDQTCPASHAVGSASFSSVSQKE